MAFVIDAFARRIVGWKVSSSATAGFVLDALEQAIHARRPTERDALVHHSDRGSQYLTMSYTQRLAEAKLVPSVGSVGDGGVNQTKLPPENPGRFKPMDPLERGVLHGFEVAPRSRLWISSAV